MTGIQIENGHVDIANPIMEAFARTRIPGQARQVLDFIIRKTYGWKKKTDFISLSQFCAGTGIKKQHVIRAIHVLEEMNVIVAKNGNGIAKEYGLNKHFETWVPYPKKVTLPKLVTTVPQKGNASYPKKVPTKDTTTKDTITKDNADRFSRFWAAYPRKAAKKKACAIFLALSPSEDLLLKMLSALAWQVKSEQWTKDGGQYIPHPTTWLNNARWEDEPEAPPVRRQSPSLLAGTVGREEVPIPDQAEEKAAELRRIDTQIEVWRRRNDPRRDTVIAGLQQKRDGLAKEVSA